MRKVYLKFLKDIIINIILIIYNILIINKLLILY